MRDHVGHVEVFRHRYAIDFGETFGVQQVVDDISRGNANAGGGVWQPHGCCLRQSFGRERGRVHRRRGADPRKASEKTASALYPRHRKPPWERHPVSIIGIGALSHALLRSIIKQSRDRSL
jgi:hypothetical protein